MREINFYKKFFIKGAVLTLSPDFIGIMLKNYFSFRSKTHFDKMKIMRMGEPSKILDAILLKNKQFIKAYVSTPIGSFSVLNNAI